MSAKLSTEVNHRVRAGRRVLAAFEVEGPRAAAGFLDATQDLGEAAHPDGFLAAVARKLRAALDHLVVSDYAVAHAAARESRLRRQRKADKRQLAVLIVALRRLVLAYYTDPDLDNLGLQPVNVPISASMRKFLSHMAQDPDEALRPRQRRTPKFCRTYFDLCDASALECDRKALDQPELVLEPARIAVRLAEEVGDRHLVNHSLGVLAHAHLAVEQPIEGFAVLESYRRQARQCCRRCHAEWLRRHGDYLVEIRDGAAARRVLNRCLRVTENLDGAGRVRFVHGISHYYLGQRDRALDDELRVLESLDLASPRGYFLDALAMLAVFLRGAEPRHDRHVLNGLARFRKRIEHLRGWRRVRSCLRWVEGQVIGRLGDATESIRRLDGVRRYLRENGPVRQAVAVTLDVALLYCRHEFGDNHRPVKSMLRACLDQLPPEEEATGEEALLRTGLDRVLAAVDYSLEDGFEALVDFRSSFVVPVPGILPERLSGGTGIVLLG